MDSNVPSGSQHARPDDFKIKGAAATRTLPTRNHHGGEETCTICLEPISERAVATPCNHLTFDFICLVSWLQERPNCPLCKAEVKEVQYDWRSADDFKTYRVPKTASPRPSQARNRRRQPRIVPPQPVSEDPSLERRRYVYRHRLYALHVGSNRISRYGEFSPEEFGRSAELQSKARMFLRRELQIFTFLGNGEFLMEYVVAVLKRHEMNAADGKAESLLREFLGEANARQMLHELRAWLRSPFIRLREWDAEVRYLDSARESEGEGLGTKSST